MSLNRNIPPEYFAIQQQALPPAELHILTNTTELFALRIGQQPIVRLDVVFAAGMKHEQVEGSSYFLMKCLTDGTKKRTSAQISEYFDSFGAFGEFNHHADYATMTVSCLSKYLPKILPLLQEMLLEATFPEKEIETSKNVTLQGLRVNLEKTAFVAGQTLKERLFGVNHPYGKYVNEASIGAITPQILKESYPHLVQNQRFKVFVTGDVSDNLVQQINATLGQIPFTTATKETPTWKTPEATTSGEIHLPKANSLQASIRIGRVMLNRKSPDFSKFLVMNEVLGGYFGSRLMKNIREEKGFTYGISSQLVPLVDSGYWVIGTDVKKENLDETLHEIQKEISIIKTELVKDEELEKAKNYMVGQFVGSLNTPFDLMERHKIVQLNGLNPDFYDHHVSRIRAVTAADVQAMANQYLNNLEIVSVG